MPISKHKEESWQWFFYMTPKHSNQKQKLTSGMTSNQKASIDQRKQQNERQSIEWEKNTCKLFLW